MTTYDYDDDHDTNNGGSNTLKIEASIECSRKRDGCDFAEAKQVDHQCIEPSPFKGLDSNNCDEGDDFDYKQAKDLSHWITGGSTVETGPDEVVDEPNCEKPPSCASEACA